MQAMSVRSLNLILISQVWALALGVIAVHAETHIFREKLDLSCSGVFQNSSAVIGLRFSGNKGEILPAPIMVPHWTGPFVPPPQAKWIDIDKLVVTEDSISGDVNLGFGKKSIIEINRKSGTIQTRGGYNEFFSGKCEKVEPDEKKF
jgi:hypothetical protein